MMGSSEVPVFLARAAIAVASGETAIRFLSWWRLCRRSGPLLATPLVVLVALFSTCEFVIYLAVLFRQTSKPETAIGAPMLLFERAAMFACFCYATYAVTTIVYRHSLRRALTEMLIRLFHFASGAMVCLGVVIVSHHWI